MPDSDFISKDEFDRLTAEFSFAKRPQRTQELAERLEEALLEFERGALREALDRTIEGFPFPPEIGGERVV